MDGRWMRWTPLAISALLLSACGSGEPAADPGAASRTIEVAMTDELRFEPSELTVEAGETVRFEVSNEGTVAHEFLVGDEAAQAEFAAEMASGDMDHATDDGVSVEPGETEAFEYTFPDEPGRMLGGCHEPGHYEGGMVAEITIQ